MLKSIIAVVFLFLLFNSKVAAQQETVEVPAELLLTAVKKAETHVMFNITDSKLHILDQDMKPLYTGNEIAPEFGDYTVYAVEYVNYYIQQQKAEKITLTADYSGAVRFGKDRGAVVMRELAMLPCPPICP